jgi:hypothetical protein
MKNKADYSKYECPYSHLEKECGHELHGPEGYQDEYSVWCACGFRGPVFYLDPDELGLKLKKEKDSQESTEQALTKPVVVPRTFTVTWKDAQKEPPKECGRYWCVVRDVNDLGTSYYQWNCAYHPENTWGGKWSSNALLKDVVLWTEFPQIPV